MAAALRAIGDHQPRDAAARAVPEVAKLLDSTGPTRARAFEVLFDLSLRLGLHLGIYTLFPMLARHRTILARAELLGSLERLLVACQANDGNASWVLDTMVPVVERSVPAMTPDEADAPKAVITQLLTLVEARPRLRMKPASVQRLRAVVGQGTLDLDAISPGDPFGVLARAIVQERAEAPQGLGPFLTHLAKPGKAGRPGIKWFDQARTLGAELEDAPALVRALLKAAVEAEDGTITYGSGPDAVTVPMFVHPTNEATLRYCVWAAAALQDEAAIPLLRSLAQKCATMNGGSSGQPRALAVALACPRAIAEIGGPASLTALVGLQRSVRYATVVREISKAIDALATSANVSRSELLETGVERFELDDSGHREAPVGDWTAVLQMALGGDLTVGWRAPDGRATASLPKAVREANADAAKSVGTLTKAIRDTVATERARLDRMFLEDRRWPVATWRQRYLDHPMTGALTRGLVWRFRVGGDVFDGIPVGDGGTATDAEGGSFPVPADAEVELWHPILVGEDQVRRWRERLLHDNLVQPVKQIFRELYVVTPAEQETRTYSNRFASHIIRQVQARALMKARGWAPVVLAWWDDGIDHGVSRRAIDAHGIRAEFFYDPITDITPTSGDLYPYCSTDQVRFFAIATDRAIEIVDVPPMVFTEVMRDVDLFVGVTTIGADQQWLDRGERRFDTYWHEWGFGELGQPATVRREALASILPALAIADRTKLTDRYLEVRGDLREYKIHLGSSNILMGPADTYLCIVATRHPSDDRLFLPFDDDPMLSLILSKAFLLADDTAIRDESILRQIKAS